MSVNNRPNHNQEVSESKRAEANMIRQGKIMEARYDLNQDGAPPPNNEEPYYHNKDAKDQFRGPIYRVEIGDHELGWIPQLHQRCQGDQEFWAYEVGEQVLVLCDHGDPEQSVIIGALPYDGVRPPVGHDDQSHDKRPWRESVHRIRYMDGMLVEYDRYLHRRLAVFQDGSTYTDWLLDDREDRTPRKKETNSDKSGVPPRHWRNRHFADDTDHEFLWDEDIKIHREHWKFPDASVFEYQWDEENQTHYKHYLFADGTDFHHLWNEKDQTHERKWVWPDGRIERYFWDEQAKNHHQQKQQADGTTHIYHWNEEKQSIHETKYADGTQVIFQFSEPHHLQVNFSDGSFLRYDLATHHLTAKFVGKADLEVAGDTKFTCGANVDAQIAGHLKASAQEVVEISSGVRIVLSAPKIHLNGTAPGKNVFFSGNFGFGGNVEIDGQVDVSKTVIADQVIRSKQGMVAPYFAEG
jgi:phage baseplate assembly protein gpV